MQGPHVGTQLLPQPCRRAGEAGGDWKVPGDRDYKHGEDAGHVIQYLGRGGGVVYHQSAFDSVVVA